MDYYFLLTKVKDHNKNCIIVNDTVYKYKDVINECIKLEKKLKIQLI